MKTFLLLILTLTCSFLAYVVHDQNRVIQSMLAEAKDTPPAPAITPAPSPRMEEKTATSRPFNQDFDAEKAFAMDELFAVMSKQTKRAENYVDHFDKNLLGNPTTKTHAAVYVLRCLGRETRENYLFIVDRAFYDQAAIHQKFSKAELSNFEFFLSEERFESAIFHRRFRNKMID